MKIKMKTKRILLICLSCVFALLTAFLAVSCSSKRKKMTVYNAKGELVYSDDNSSITLEYGDTYALPQNVQIGGNKAELNSVKLLYSGIEECKLAYGSYQFMKVGEYDVEYVATYKDKSYDKTFKIVCEDTVLPVINVVSQSNFGYLGSEVELPRFTYADKAGIKEDSVHFTVTSPSGKNVEISDGKFLLEELGYYVVTVTVQDNNGNTATQTVKVSSLELFVDETRVGDVIYSFDDEKYTQLTVDVKTELKIDREIVRTGYPAIDNEKEGNGVLKISSTATFGDERDTYGVRDLLTQFNLHEDLLASTGYNIVIRIAVSKDTDYVKLFRSMTNYNYASQDKDLVGQMFGLKANAWYDWEIDPISFGYHMPFENFVISFRDSGNAALYIDEIYFTPKKFVDNAIEDNVIADFDENGYLYNVFQNVYCDPTTTRAERVGGSTFSIVALADLPAANDDTAMSPNLVPSGSALKVVTGANKGGMTFMFPEAINLNEISRITFKMYLDLEAKDLSTMVIGFFNGNGYDGGNNYWTYADSHYKVKQWFEIDFETNYLRNYTSGNTVSGFYIYLASNGGWNTPVSHTFYFDEIKVTAANGHSEQVDEYLASFDTGDSLANVTQASIYRGATLAWDDDLYHKRGVLVVKPGVSGDGFSYYFDNIVTAQDTDSIIVNMAKGSDRVQKVSFYAINTNQKAFLVKEIALDGELVQEYKNYVLAGKDILASITDGKIIGLRADIIVTEVASDALLAVNEIVYYDAASDTDLPMFGDYTAQGLSPLQGTSVDLRLLDIPVADASDPVAFWTVESLKAPNGQDITVIDGYIFTPTVGGTYTLVVKAKDNAGNESNTAKTITFAIHYYEDEKAYYTDMLNFAENSSTVLVKSHNDNAFIVEDAGCEDGKGIHISFINYTSNDLIIDVGGLYQFKDIEKIEITYKITAATKQNDSWWRVFLNDNVAEGQQVVKGTGVMFTDETGRGGGSMTDFATMTITPAEANATTGLSEEDYFTKLNFGYRYGAENASAHGVTMIIDSVKIIEKSENPTDFNAADLEFNSESALNLVMEGVETSLVDLGNGNKALQAKLSQYCTGDMRRNLKINLGGLYQVSEIEKLEICFKVEAVDYTENAVWWQIQPNVKGSYGTDIFQNRVTGTSNTTLTKMNDFYTLTLTDAGNTACSLTGNTVGGTLLSQTDYLENLFFYVNGTQYASKNVMTLQIDYIRITLKTNN